MNEQMTFFFSLEHLYQTVTNCPSLAGMPHQMFPIPSNPRHRQGMIETKPKVCCPLLPITANDESGFAPLGKKRSHPSASWIEDRSIRFESSHLQ